MITNSLIEIKTANSFDDLMHCSCIRAAAFLQTEPYEEEFDGRDHSMVTHLLALVNGAPVGTMRIRLITVEDGGLVEWERLAILPTTPTRMKIKILQDLAKFCTNFTKKNKIKRARGFVANKKLIRFWEKFGYKLSDEIPAAVYNGVKYYPVTGEFGDVN